MRNQQSEIRGQESESVVVSLRETRFITRSVMTTLAAGGGRPAARAGRRGITLLEVLISMFIMLVGLLGVASLIPVGKFEQQRGAKIDRASACGRAAFREMRIRGMLNPRSWALANPGGTAVYSTAGTAHLFAWDAANSGSSVALFRAFAIDPLGVGDASSPQTFGPRFPYDTTATSPMGRIPRLTLGPLLNAAARAAIAESIFQWRDDLNYEEPASADGLPQQRYFQTTNSPAEPIQRMSAGDYSWLATVVPDPNLVGSQNALDIPVRVSVAVFYKRDTKSIPGAGERVCDLAAPTGNGETKLIVQSGNPDLALAPYSGDARKFLDVKPGQWLMIATTPDFSVATLFWHYSWQRIVAVDSVTGTGPYSRAITLAGPDQQFFASPGQNKAFLFDGIVAVYEKHMKLELDSMY